MFPRICRSGRQGRCVITRVRSTSERRDAGFTLIELLIVIVIIGILAGIVVFAVGGFGDRGEKSACEGDRRTLASAIGAYEAQNGSPPATLTELSDSQLLRSDSGLSDTEKVGVGYTLTYVRSDGSVSDCETALAAGGTPPVGGGGGPGDGGPGDGGPGDGGPGDGGPGDGGPGDGGPGDGGPGDGGPGDGGPGGGGPGDGGGDPVESTPTITGLDPSAIKASNNTAQSISINGTEFESGATVAIAPAGLTVSGVTFVDGSRIDFTVIAPNSRKGSYTVSVINPDGGAASGASLTVN
jgi:prepilin-type N-terminal cleavage/methylation domain-containing protein